MNTMIDETQALEIARREAELAYGDLAPYEVTARLEDGDWHVDYELRDPQARGGGPHFVISGETGVILSTRYEQ